MMQFIAMLTMLVDHVGIVFFSDSIVWRILGRIAFPIYAWGIVQGYIHTRSKKRYLWRLLLIGAVAQVPYMYMVSTWKINVVGTFIAVICFMGVVDACKRHGVSRFYVSVVVILGIIFFETIPLDYGSYALILILLYRYCSFKWILAGHMILNVLYPPLFGWSLIQMFSIVPTVFILYPVHFAKIKVPRWLWLSFYPAHIFILVMLGGVLHG